MAEKSALVQVVQIGAESVATPGTAVAAGKKLQSLSIEPGIQTDIDTFRAQGWKWPSLAVQNKEWTEARLTGKPTYDEIIYPLSSLVATDTPAAVTATATAQLWSFESDSDGVDTPQTYTVQHGDSTTARRFTYGLVTGLSFDISRDSFDYSGNMIGQLLTTGITLTSTTSTIPLIPISPNKLDVYLDTVAASLGTTQLTRSFNANIDVSSRFGQVWPIDSSETSFAAHVESEPTGSLRLKVAADATGEGYLTQLRTGTSRYLRIEATGDNIETGDPDTAYRITMDFALKFTDVAPYSDEDGLFMMEYTADIMHDATWGKAFQIDVVNTQTSL